MNIIFSAVLGGITTGQSNTANFVLSILRKKHKILLNKQPEKSKIFALKLIFYYCNILFIFFCHRPKVSYLMLNRTFKSFWVRDFVVIFLSGVFSKKILIHIVGNDFSAYFSSIGKIGRGIFSWLTKRTNVTFILLGESMKCEVASTLHVMNLKYRTIILPAFVGEYEVAMSFKYFQPNCNRDSPLVIGYMSNLIPDKGIFEFCEAIKLLQERYDNISFWIAGKKMPGVGYEMLDELISEERIAYTNFLSGKEKWIKLCRTNIFVLPTYYSAEFLPLSIIDALYAGCTVISCPTGEIGKYINSSNGIIVEKRSVIDLYAGICSAIYSINGYNRNNIRQAISEKLVNFESILFNEVCNG